MVLALNGQYPLWWILIVLSLLLGIRLGYKTSTCQQKHSGNMLVGLELIQISMMGKIFQMTVESLTNILQRLLALIGIWTQSILVQK